MYPILADVTVVAHLAWILFLIFGVLPGVRYRWVRWLHIGGLVYALWLTLLGWYCPLTRVEVWLRARAPGGGTYRESFVAHHVQRLVYPEVSVDWIVTATAGLLVGSIVVYLWQFCGRNGEGR